MTTKTTKGLLTFFSLACLSAISTAKAESEYPLCSEQSAGYSSTCTDAASKYNITMKAFRLRRADTDEFVTIVVKDQTFNFASVDAGQTVGSYLTDGTVPAGTYDAISPILSPIMVVSGTTEIGGGATCRTGSGDLTDGGSAGDYIFDLSSDDENIEINSDDNYGMDRAEDREYINDDGNYVLVDSSVINFPIALGESDIVTFTMVIDAGESVEYEWDAGECIGAYSGGLQVNLTAVKN